MKDSIKVFAPATVANVVCGFDVLGFAVNAPGDEVVMRRVEKPGITIKKITGDDGRLPLDAAKNTVSASVKHYLDHIGQPDLGIEIELHKKMPIGSGLGSSSASTVAGLFAINSLLDNKLTQMELVPFAMKGEELACGYGHADNVAPAILGGFVLIRSYEPLDIIRLPHPESLFCAIVFPEVDVPTRDAREMIRKKVFLKDAVTQWGNIAGLVSGLFLKDIDLIGRSMKDILIEPIRSILIPDFYKMREMAMESGINIRQFDIWIADLNPGKGTVPGKIRPVVVVQSNGLNKVAHPSTIICPLTSDLTIQSKILRLNISCNSKNGLEKDSAILIDQIRAIDNLKLLQHLGNLEESYHEALKSAIVKVLALN